MVERGDKKSEGGFEGGRKETGLKGLIEEMAGAAFEGKHTTM